jgi:hypothetical protein
MKLSKIYFNYNPYRVHPQTVEKNSTMRSGGGGSGSQQSKLYRFDKVLGKTVS